MFSVGDATITRVEETNLPSYPLRDIFPEFTDGAFGRAQIVAGAASL